MSVRRLSEAVALGGAALMAVGASSARAFAKDTKPPRGPDAEITTDTAAQLYELRSPSGQTVIGRRRLTTTIGVTVHDLLEDSGDPRAPTLTFRARLRYDADEGGSPFERTPRRPEHLVPELDRAPFDLMYGYLEGRRLARGLLGFRLGRQYVTDALGWWSFDGGLVRVTTPFHVALETYGGLEQRGGLTLSTSRYERDGVWRGDRTGYDPGLYPSLQPSDVAPAIGGAIETADLPWLSGRLTYRRVYNTGDSIVRPERLAEPGGMRISQERVGGSADATLPTLGGVKAGLAYDLFVRQTSTLFASLDWYASPKVTVSLDYDYFRPTFDADSIWNFFVRAPMNDVGVRASWDPSWRLALAGGLRARAFELERAPAPGVDPLGGAHLAGRYRVGGGHVGARAAVDLHRTGERAGIDFYGERPVETRFVLQARAGAWSWRDALRTDREATNLGYALGAGYRLAPRSLLLADFQHDMNRIGGQRFRAMLWLTIALSKETAPR